MLLRQTAKETLACGLMASVMWFRRDLRLFDNPALNAAISAAKDGSDGRVVPLFILDENLWGPSGEARRAYMSASLASLNESLAGNLVIRIGEPTKVIS